MGNARRAGASHRSHAVHPHVHGERGFKQAARLHRVGSSPRAWGTREIVFSKYFKGRFIPTCMGNAPVLSGGSRHTPVHPHVHGERLSSVKTIVIYTGSSPRAWGTRSCSGSIRCRCRFIPTCMGNATCNECIFCCSPVHPHVHGERSTTNLFSRVVNGSSPRAWGTLITSKLINTIGRFIPTCMGNAFPIYFISIMNTVHPHVHGERFSWSADRGTPSGSSPRAWGTQDDLLVGVAGDRFIPTCMGNATPTTMRIRGGAVHPHVHGERLCIKSQQPRVDGSSPRAWGTLFRRRVPHPDVRFIPTCMGNARGSRRSRIPAPVHPHVHGERRISAVFWLFSVGSSPRAWGTRGNWCCAC